VSGTYGTFAVVIALLVWLHLGAQMTIYAAELNVVLERKLYPRSLIGPPDEPADQAALTALAEAEERNEIEHIAVSFDPDPQADPDPESSPKPDADAS